MSTRNLVLTDHHDAVIDELVRSGRYKNASEVVYEGLRLVEEREAEEAAKLEVLREAARVGFDDLDAGRYHEFSDEAGLGEHIAQLVSAARARARKPRG